MNKLYISLLAMIVALCATSCDDDDCNLIHDDDIYGIPNVIKGSFPEGTLTPALGDEIKFAPKLMNKENAEYSWTVNGVEVSTDSAYTYKVDSPCRLSLVCEIKNDLGKAVLKADIISSQNFSDGFLFADNSEIGFYDASTQKAYYDCFYTLNYGTSITSQGDVLATVMNDKIYILIKNGVTNFDHIVIADANTLKKTNSLQGETNCISFIPLDERYVLMTGSSKIFRLDITTNQIVQLASSNPIFSGMVFNGKLVTCATSSAEKKVYAYDVDAIINASGGEVLTGEEIGVTQKIKSKFALAGDGNLYTTGVEDGIAGLYKIKPDFTTESISLPFTLPVPGWSELYFNGVVASVAENAVFIPASDGAIYRYVVGDETSLNQPFIAAPADDGVVLYGTAIQENPSTGDLCTFYATKVNSYTYNNGKIVIRSSAGIEKQTIGSETATPKAAIFLNK